MGWDGMGWDGMGRDGMGWDGMGWDRDAVNRRDLRLTAHGMSDLSVHTVGMRMQATAVVFSLGVSRSLQSG